MQYLKQFLAFLFSRQMLAFLAMVLLALAIWFIGPLLAVDGLRPLALGGRARDLHRAAAGAWHALAGVGSLQPGGIAALCLLLWHAGPLLAIGAARPLAPRGCACVDHRRCLAGMCALLALPVVAGLRNNEDLLARFLSFGRTRARRDRKEEIKTVTAAVNRALAQLKGSARTRGGLRRLFEGKRYLYELPWYMVLGSAGAGKTTALLNAGIAVSVGAPDGQCVEAHGVQATKAAPALRLVVHQRGRADRHRRSLHHAGKQPRDTIRSSGADFSACCASTARAHRSTA
jgi:type VI secretion system protein ImpL